MKQIKILKINQNNLLGSLVCGITDDNFSKQGTYNFLIKTLELYRKKEFEDDEKVTEFIKLTLSYDEEKAREQWFNGVIWEGRLYKGWFASVGGMKQEDSKSKSKCEVYFVDENVEEFKNYFETIISLGKFNKLDKNEERYVNKEILSRLSLATSDLITEITMPNIIILPTATLDWKKEYKTVEPYKIKEIVKDKNDNEMESEKIKYNLVDYTFDGKIDVFDGGGIATSKVFDDIGQTLEKKRNDIDFAIIRGYGLGIKGLITRFNILGYLELINSRIGNTDFCKKENDKFYLLDMFENWIEVTDNTLLLNESMVKLAKLFKKEDDKETYGMEEYKTRLEKINTEEHIDIYNLLNKLYITKINKKNEELEEYRRLNYQLFNVLGLTEKEYLSLAQEDFKLFQKLLKPYDCDAEHKEFKENIDIINIFYNQCADSKEELDDLKEITNCVDKSNALINLNQKNIHLAYVKKNLAKLIEKKIRNMANGKLTLKASYNYMAIDPISYMNFAISREQGENGLKEGQFYCRNIDDGETRTIFRNPCMAYSEVHNINFIKNNFFDNWLCKSNELVYFNQKSDIQNLIGSADFDGDCVNMVYNEIVKNAVIVPRDGKYFCFTEDGHKKKGKFNAEGRFLATYKPSGNLIGSIATLATSVNNESQTLPTYYRTVDNKFKTYKAVKKLIEKDNIDGINDIKGFDKKIEIIDNAIKQFVNEGKLGYSRNADTEVQREKIKQRFFENEKNIYSLLHCSSLVIDSPKTMNVIDAKAYTEEVAEQYWNRKDDARIFKPYFLQYKKNLHDISKGDTYSSSAKSCLDKFAKKVEDNLLNIVAKRKHDFGNNSKLLLVELAKIDEGQYNEDDAYKLWDILIKLHDEYAKKWDEAMNLTREKKSKKLNEIEAEYTLIADELMGQYDLLTIGKALSKIKDCRERFIICFFFPVLNEVDKLNPSLKSFYYRDDNGDIEYMYKTYWKEEKPVNLSDAAIEKLSIKDMVRLKQLVELRFKSNNVEEITTKIYEGLERDGYYDLDVNDNLEIFSEFKKALGDRNTVRVKCFMKRKDGTDSISKSAFGIVIDK